jgi:hypothetical protein
MALVDYIGDYDTLPSLGFDIDDYSFMVTETLDALDITLESESTDKILHSVAKVKYWERVVALTSTDMDFSADGASYNRSQVNKMAKENLQSALNEASAFIPDYQIQVGSFSYNPDPYIYNQDREIYL